MSRSLPRREVLVEGKIEILCSHGANVVQICRSGSGDKWIRRTDTSVLPVATPGIVKQEELNQAVGECGAPSTGIAGQVGALIEIGRRVPEMWRSDWNAGAQIGNHIRSPSAQNGIADAIQRSALVPRPTGKS